MRRVVSLLPLALLACTETAAVLPEEILELDICPAEQDLCRKVADGASAVTVRACIPEDVALRQAELPLELRLSAGRWQTGAAPESPLLFKGTLGADRCLAPTFLTTTALTPVRVDAVLTLQIGDKKSPVTMTDYVTFAAATLASLEVATTPKSLSAAALQEVALSVRVRSTPPDGKPTEGTRVRFALVSVDPPTAAVSFSPSEVRVDRASDVVTGAMVVIGSPKSVTFEISAEPPQDELGNVGESVSTTLMLVAASMP